MSIIDEHIKETEEIISSNDQAIAKEQYNKLFSIFTPTDTFSAFFISLSLKLSVAKTSKFFIYISV